MQTKKRLSSNVFGFIAKQTVIFFLRCWSRFARRKLKKYENIRKILVIKFGGGFGDLILITPALKSLRKKYPQAEITILTYKPYLAELLLHSGYIDPAHNLQLGQPKVEVMCGVDKCLFFPIYDFYRWEKLFSVGFIRKFGNLLFRVRREDFDVLIDLQSFGQLSLISLIVLGSGARYRIGLSTPHRSFFYHNSIIYSDGVMNFKDWYLKVVQLIDSIGNNIKQRDLTDLTDRAFAEGFAQAGNLTMWFSRINQLNPFSPVVVSSDDSQTEVIIGESEKQFAKDILAANNVSDNDFLMVLHPGGGRPAQHWLPERFAELANKLISEYKIKIALIGNDSEIKIAKQVESGIKFPVINLAGKTGMLKNLAGVIARSNMFIGNDSGPMHLAIALKIPTIGIFGPGAKEYMLYGNIPWYQYVRKKEIDNWDCWPCENYNCADNRCLKLITVDDVFATTQQMLKSIGKEHSIKRSYN